MSILTFNCVYVDNGKNCKNDLKDDWIGEAEFNNGIPCSYVTCDMLAKANMCSVNISSSPISSCVKGAAGLAKQFCRKSCYNCSK